MNAVNFDIASLAARGTRTGADRPAAAKAPADVTQESARPAAAELTETVEAAVARVQGLDHRLSFQVDESSGRTVVYVRDAETSEVIKQIPAEEMLAISRHLRTEMAEAQAASGLLLTDEA